MAMKCGRALLKSSRDAALGGTRRVGGLLGVAGRLSGTVSTQGNRLSCRDQEGRRGSEEAVPGPSVFPSGEPGVSGDFWALGSSLRSPAEGEGHEGFPPPPDKDLESPSSTPAQGIQSLSRELRASALCPGLEAQFHA